MEEEVELRIRGLEVRQMALETRQTTAETQQQQMFDLLSRNTTLTEKLAADNAVVREWVENWQAGMKVADLIGKIVEGPLGKVTKWVAGITGGLVAAWATWRANRGH